MPQVGERKTIGDVTGEWDGQTWRQVETAAPSSHFDPNAEPSYGLLDYIPGFKDTLNLPINAIRGAQAIPDVVRGLKNHPLDTLKGFLQGASEATTPARAGTLALLTGGASLPAAGWAVAGNTAAQGVKAATGSAKAPHSIPQALLEDAEAAAIPAIPAGVGKASTALRLSAKAAGGGTGAVLGGLEGYRRGGVPGAVEGAVLGGTFGTALSSPRVSRILRGLDPEAAAPSDVPEGGFAQQPKTNGRLVKDVSYGDKLPDWFEKGQTSEDYWPQREIRSGEPSGPTEMSPRIVGKSPSLSDSLVDALDHVRTSSEPATETSGPPAQTMTSAGKPAVSQTRYDELMNRFGGGVKAEPVDATQSINRSSSDVADDIIPKSFEGLDDAPKTMGDWFDRGSDISGAQAAPMKGEEGYVYDPESANLRDDPRTSIDDLLKAREDALTSNDLETARALSHSISQRNKIALNINGYGRPFNKGISVLRVKMPPSISSIEDLR